MARRILVVNGWSKAGKTTFTRWLEANRDFDRMVWDTSLPIYSYPMSTLRTGPGGRLWLAGYGGAILRWNR